MKTMEIGSWVIYYPKKMRDRFPNIELLWQQNAWLGQIRRINSETITVYYETQYGAVPMEEDIPQRYVKLARDVGAPTSAPIRGSRYSYDTPTMIHRS